MRNNKQKKAFTLIELLVGLTISAILLTAVATLTYAVSQANESSSDISQKQAQVRFGTLKISELIKHCRMVCYKSPGGSAIAIWRADDNGDSNINPSELMYIEYSLSQNCIRLIEYKPSESVDNEILPLDLITDGSITKWLKNYCTPTYTNLLWPCTNGQFTCDTAPPWTTVVSLSFDLEEDAVWKSYQINASLRAQAEHLLDIYALGIVSDDDE